MHHTVAYVTTRDMTYDMKYNMAQYLLGVEGTTVIAVLTKAYLGARSLPDGRYLSVTSG